MVNGTPETLEELIRWVVARNVKDRIVEDKLDTIISDTSELRTEFNQHKNVFRGVWGTVTVVAITVSSIAGMVLGILSLFK